MPDGRKVLIEYTLTLDDGKVVDTNVNGQPLEYVQGSQQILPALEQALEGVGVNEKKQVTLPPEKAYGAIDPDARQTIPLEKIPEDSREVGARLVAQDSSGRKHQLRVHDIKGDEAVLDLNHPLAGQTLHFEVRVVEIR